MAILNDTLVSFENVGVRYGIEKEVLKDINFNLKSGDFIFLIGESGSGKTTFLNLVNASLRPSRGFLNVLGYETTNIAHKSLAFIRRKMGIIFQDFKLIEHMTIFENIALPLKIMKIDQDNITKRVEEMLQWIELQHYRNHLPMTLSGGEQQRVAIARAVITNPAIILADEPTGSIDINMAQKILYMLEDLNSQGTPVIFATHNLELVNQSSHKVALLDNKTLTFIK